MPKLIEKDLYSIEIKKAINKEITQHEAGLKLGISDRQVRRIIANYKIYGDKIFVHQSSGKPSHNKKIPSELADEIVNEYLKEYSDYGFTHFYEEQGYKYGVSLQSVINIFNHNEIISPYAQHKTVKLYNENVKIAIKEKSLTKDQEKLYKQRKQEDFEKHIRKSVLHYSFGEEVQMDAAFWIWFGEEETALHLAVDKATVKVLSGYFDYEETTNAYLIVLMNMVINYGIPKGIRTDKRNSFSVNNARSSKTKLNLTQFGRICEDLEIDLKCNSNPLFKPNAERENGTFKRRLKAELRHEGITNIEEANKYLNDIFIPKINKRFSNNVNPNKNVMRKNDYTQNELNFIISIREERIIDNASSVKYYHNYYLPIAEDTGEVAYFKSGTECTIVKTYDNKLFGIINEKVYMLNLVEQQSDENINASTHGYKPSENNPWKRFRIM
mgnify:CR=1 FL=1